MVNKVKGSVSPDSSEVPYTGLESAEVTVEAVLDELLTGIEALPVDPLNTKVVEIGDWNMVDDSSVSIAHGLTLSKIREVSAVIRNDADSKYLRLPMFSTAGDAQAWIGEADATEVDIFRLTGGVFDSTLYNDIVQNLVPYNRGWITIQYAD